MDLKTGTVAVESYGMLSSRLFLHDFLFVKKYSLLFDKVGIFLHEKDGNTNKVKKFINSTPDIAWLVEQDIMEFVPIRANFNYDDSMFVQINSSLGKSQGERLNLAIENVRHSVLITSVDYDEKIPHLKAPLVEEELRMRQLVINLRYQQMNAYPILTHLSFHLDMKVKEKSDVYYLLLKRVPMPNLNEPWEKIIEFKKDEDSHVKLSALKNWINDVADGKLSIIELSEKIDWLLHEYEQHMKLHQLRSTSSVIETVIKTGLETTENITKFNLSKLADSFFSVKKQKIALLEAERNAPGKELAYIHKVEKEFT